jgi:hypothetical protein
MTDDYERNPIGSGEREPRVPAKSVDSEGHATGEIAQGLVDKRQAEPYEYESAPQDIDEPATDEA